MMAKNTPTPEELITALRRDAGDYGKVMSDASSPSETLSWDQGEVRAWQAADALEAALAERDEATRTGERILADSLNVSAERDEANRDAVEMARELSALTEVPEEDLLDVTTQRDALLAERDAVAVVIEQASAMLALITAWNASPEQLDNLSRILSTAPTTLLAQRDARVLRAAADDFEANVSPEVFAQQSAREGHHWHGVIESWDEQGPFMDWLRNRADRIEREAGM